MKAFRILFLVPLALAAGNPKLDALVRSGQWEPSQWAGFKPLLNRPAPALELSRWTPPGPVKLRGRIVVVDFWATWCGPCIQSIPHNNQLQAKYRSRGVLVLGACTGGREEPMAEVARANGMAYPTAVAAASSAAAYHVRFFPTYAVIDRKGALRAIGILPDRLEAILNALLAEQPR